MEELANGLIEALRSVGNIPPAEALQDVLAALDAGLSYDEFGWNENLVDAVQAARWRLSTQPELLPLTGSDQIVYRPHS